MDLRNDIDWKSLIVGAAIAAALVIIGSWGYDFAYPFSAIGLLYVGYKGKNMKYGTVLGAVAAIPMAILASYGAFGEMAESIEIYMMIIILLVGAFIGFVGALAHRDREKAKIEYEKKQQIGKNKNKKKNNN